MRKSKPYQCPFHLYNKLEEIARLRRKRTGDEGKWTHILVEILDVGAPVLLAEEQAKTLKP